MPLSRNCRKPIAPLTTPNTGSTVRFLKQQSARLPSSSIFARSALPSTSRISP